MKSILLRCPIKSGKVEAFRAFIAECLNRADEYKEMLNRYDMHSVKIWLGKHGGKDYAYVFHHVGDQFQQKMQTWQHSKHHFDSWFREALMDLYDMADSEEMLELENIADFLD